MAGLRTSSFEAGALYWHEGMNEWRPIYEFPESTLSAPKEWRRISPRDMPTAPKIPTEVRSAKLRRRRPRLLSSGSKPASQQIGGGGRAIFLAIIIIAVLLTIGILLLLMQV